MNKITFINSHLLIVNGQLVDLQQLLDFNTIAQNKMSYYIFCFLGCWCLILGLLFYFFNWKEFSFFSFLLMLAFFFLFLSNYWFEEKSDFIFTLIDLTCTYYFLAFFLYYYYFRLNNKFCLKTIITDIKVYLYTKYLRIILSFLFVIIVVINIKLLLAIILLQLLKFALFTKNDKLFLILSILWILLFFC
jgi:hypothetical protein